MTSIVKISDIIHCATKSPSDIAKSRLKEGRLPAGPVLNRIQQGQTIEVIVLKTHQHFCVTLQSKSMKPTSGNESLTNIPTSQPTVSVISGYLSVLNF